MDINLRSSTGIQSIPSLDRKLEKTAAVFTRAIINGLGDCVKSPAKIPQTSVWGFLGSA